MKLLPDEELGYGGSKKTTKGPRLEFVDPHSPVCREEDDEPIEVLSSGCDGLEVAKEDEVELPVWSLVLRVLAVLTLLYFFVCSLDLMGSSFKLLGGKEAGRVFSQNKIISNPVAGLMIGVLVTVLLQSSSTSSSLVVAMVAGRLMNVETAVPIIMGANIGTSVTNTIVALSQIQDREMYKRAFAAATVHDMFNILTMSLLLPIEWVTHSLTKLSSLIVSSLPMKPNENADVELLSRFTDPLTDLVVMVNKTYIKEISKGHEVGEGEQVLKRFCDDGMVVEDMERERCDSLFSQFDLSDKAAGSVLLTLSLVVMFICLILMVKVLKSVFQGHISKVINKTVNAGFPGRLNFLTGYVAIVVGAIMTVLVQSSSIFTSTLTPLVGLNIISLERAFPLTLGSNIGTTVTSMLAALASDSNFDAALQISFCHLLFNVIGILIWYPIPAMRKIPLNCARQLGRTTSKYKWFAFAYVFVVFVLVPGIIFALSMLGTIYVIGFCSIIASIAIVCAVLKLLQRKWPSILPTKLRDFKFLPKWMRSLEPVHNVGVAFVDKFKRCRRTRGTITRRRTTTESSLHLTCEVEHGLEVENSGELHDETDGEKVKNSLYITQLLQEGKGKLVVGDGKVHQGKEATEQMGTDSGVPSSNCSSSSRNDLIDEHSSRRAGSSHVTTL